MTNVVCAKQSEEEEEGAHGSSAGDRSLRWFQPAESLRPVVAQTRQSGETLVSVQGALLLRMFAQALKQHDDEKHLLQRQHSALEPKHVAKGLGHRLCLATLTLCHTPQVLQLRRLPKQGRLEPVLQQVCLMMGSR